LSDARNELASLGPNLQRTQEELEDSNKQLHELRFKMQVMWSLFVSKDKVSFLFMINECEMWLLAAPTPHLPLLACHLLVRSQKNSTAVGAIVCGLGGERAPQAG
jgi:hypothetical protein